MHILIVDDDPRLRDTLSRGLEHVGHDVRTAADGDEAERMLAAEPADLVLLDVMMPGRDGWQVLDDLRADGLETPVIFLTARDAVDERVRGLTAGADDYLSKPFAFEELAARIEAVARRREHLPTIECGPFRIDPGRRIVTLDGRRLELAPREFDLLLALARAHGRALGREELLREVWGIDFDPGTNTVDVHVARLRRRLAPRGKELIETEVGVGYRLTTEIDSNRSKRS